MDRRGFIKNVGLASLLPAIGGSLLWACRQPGSNSEKRIFVFIQLMGGNDGLNTLIPLDNYKKVAAARPNLYIPEDKILDLRNNALTGLHPSMAGIRDMYNNGLVSFVQNVGYENPNYSHFRSAEIWLTGSRSNELLLTGWVGRYLETKYIGYPKGFPNTDYPHPPAIKVGESGTILFEATSMDMSIVLSPNENGLDVDSMGNSKVGKGYAVEEVSQIKEILIQTEQYSDAVGGALAVPFKHSSMYPEKGENRLADQLKTVAKLINGGLGTSVYHVNMGGFDTHEHQAEEGDRTKGTHAQLLAKVSQAITCFWDDVVAMGRENDVAGMTVSEFGRRIISNSSCGTDHGAAQPLIIFGNGVQGGIVGDNPVIPDQAKSMDNLVPVIGFNSVYTTIMTDWFKAEANMASKVVGGEHATLPIFKI